MEEAFLGEVRVAGWPRVPEGWLPCDGRLVWVFEYPELFKLIGTTYGGDGQKKFGIPDLRGRTPIGAGAGPGLSPRSNGQMIGEENVILTSATMPRHTHIAQTSSKVGTLSTPSGNAWADTATAQERFSDQPPNAAMAEHAISSSGRSLGHDNMMPFQVMGFVIATSGAWPERP
ncbi:hypothetical protein BWI17_13085 [Betaproteobacteria bacterium GR16-43]|nr:hypothetical protein BWI17_13085 [Betaproteobacteria bacterium GR16-43]